jgi:RelA/SpoT family (p)ppGpp synthetase
MATVRNPIPAEHPGARVIIPENPLRAPQQDGVRSIGERFDALLARVKANRPNDDISLIRKAWDFTVKHHEGQLRASGQPYIIHPLEVAEVLAEMKLDSTAIAAGLLHDSVEDTPATNEEIQAGFGEQVAHIVDGVTKIDKIQFANREDRQAENVRKMLLAMVSDIRVVLIKLADRLNNMRTLEHLKPDRQEAIARETLDIYAPLAHRLGMGKVRGELEDLAFRYTDPVSYERTAAAVEARRAEGEQFLRSVEDLLVEQLRENGIQARVEWRIKRLYSIHQKIERQKITFDQVYDLLAIRVLTQDVASCYAVFGLIHTLWRPVPGRIKDFIAMPRANRYQSLHTTVIAEGGHQFEVQIRTEEMHRIAEEGIAAHWKYKAGDSPVTARDEERLNWIRQLVDWQKEMTDPNEFLSSLKMDLYPDEVYTFTPKGKVVVVPAGGTPVDFAYTIHTEVGHTCVGAKVNGRMVPLRTRLRTGDIVEIVTQKDHKPSRDWLTFVKSPRARNKIKHWLNEDQRRRAVDIGRKLLEKEARRFKVPRSMTRTWAASPATTAWPPPPTSSPPWARASTPPTRCSTSSLPATPISPPPSPPPNPNPAKRPCPMPCASSTSPAPTPSRSKARTTCSSTAPAVAIPSAARRSSAMSRVAKASPSTRAAVPTCRTCSTKATAASPSNGPAPKPPPAPRSAIPSRSLSSATTAPACSKSSPPSFPTRTPTSAASRSAMTKKAKPSSNSWSKPKTSPTSTAWSSASAASPASAPSSAAKNYS